MSDEELEVLYKSKLSESHFAGLRAVYLAGTMVEKSLSIPDAPVTEEQQ